MHRALAIVLAVTALTAASGASAHGDGAARGFRSTIESVQPPVPGVQLEILDGEDRFLLVNETGETVVVLGYDGEPYLRVTPDAAYRNVRSSATYLNEDRYGDVELPDAVDPEAEPEWEQIEDEPQVEWHDHRIHWMSRTLPPAVAAAPDKAQHVLDWEVPLEVGGRPVTVAGSLAYEPPDEGSFSPILVVPLAALALVGAAAVWYRRRPGNPPS